MAGRKIKTDKITGKIDDVTENELAAALDGVELFLDAVRDIPPKLGPRELTVKRAMELMPHLSERQVMNRLNKLAAEGKYRREVRSNLGGGGRVMAYIPVEQ